MKKVLILIFSLLIIPCFSFAQDEKPLEAGVTFDWISKTQMQRDENIEQIKNAVFNSVVLTYPRDEFKAQYTTFLKDQNHLRNFEDISAGKTEDEKAYYCAFNLGKTSILLMYAIQYKDDMRHIYYYDAMGNLWLIDIFSNNYPKFPYESYQYNVKGQLIAAYHYNSSYDQYAYDAKKKFRGRWYRENYYNRRAKVIMTRTNY